VDGLSSVVGSLMGTSPIAAFIESASGIREGGRTGITAVCVAAWYFVALFFTPVLGAPPSPLAMPSPSKICVSLFAVCAALIGHSIFLHVVPVLGAPHGHLQHPVLPPQP
jgi:xanthine/uracil/vitamin C permease (AzgA family)